MKVRSVLNSHIANQDLCPGALTIDEWMTKTWLETRLEEKIVPIFPMWPIRDAISKHDIHHILTGYDTTVVGEAELAAWELGSGGCAFNVLFWIDRVAFSLIGLFVCPRLTMRAFRKGLGCRNLFSRNLKHILDSEVSEIQEHLRI